MTWTHKTDVLVTFDFDAESLQIQRSEGRHRGPAFESHGVFGPKVGIWRVLDVLESRGIKGTFFVPGYVTERWTSVVKEVISQGHEASLHGYLHEYATAMAGIHEERMVLERAISAFEETLGQRPKGFRPPGFLYSQYTRDLLIEYDFVYGSSMQDDDAAYLYTNAQGESLAEIPCLWHLCDDLFGWQADVKLPPSHVEEHWATELREIGRYPGRAYVLTLHPQLMGHPGRLRILERVLDEAIELGASFRTCIDVATEKMTQAR